MKRKPMKPFFTLLVICMMPFILLAQGKIDVFDINPGSSNGQQSFPYMLTEFKNKLYFFANDGNHGFELWRLDSAANTSIVTDIYPGATGQFSGITSALRKMHITLGVDSRNGDTSTSLYFVAKDSTHGYELYAYNSKSAPLMAHEFTPGPGGFESPTSYNQNIAILNKKVYITSLAAKGVFEFDPVTGVGRKLNGAPMAGITSAFTYKGKIYFISNSSQVTCYDPVTDNITAVFAGSYVGADMYEINGLLYFFTVTPGPPSPSDLTVFDGVNPPSKVAKAYSQAGVMGFTSGTKGVGVYKGKVYFNGINNTTGFEEVHCYDPVTNKTNFAFTTLPNDNTSASGFIEAGDKMYFFAANDTANHKFALYDYDGNKITILVDLAAAGFTYASTPYCVGSPVLFNNSIYFTGKGPAGVELYRYTPAGLNVSAVSFKADVNIYPNPSSFKTTIEISLKQAESLSIQLTDITGKKVLQIPAKQYAAGKHNVDVNVSSYATGTYYVSLLSTDGKLLYSSKMLKL